ncbi:MAG: shikimate dehydrogenase [Candidatus Omnitrophota bacterium]
MENSQRKKRYGLLGKNIGYSLSPAMHNAAFKHFGINAEYELFDCDESEVNDFLENKAAGGQISGFNVTVPYKIKIKKYLLDNRHKLHDLIKVIGGVNTVNVLDGTLEGYNTDGEGFYRDLLERDLDPKEKFIFIFGAGGAGSALALYLCGVLKDNYPAGIHIYDPDQDHMDALKRLWMYSNYVPGEFVKEKDIKSTIDRCFLVVNATPLGTKEGDNRSAVPLECLKDGMAVYDLVYARETALIKAAKEKGLTAVNGLGMLINQAALAFEIWTGKPFNEVKKVMKEAVV